MRTYEYTEILAENVNFLIKRVELKKASAIIIDGSLGEGKTTLAVQIADQINAENGLPPIKFEEQLAMGAADFIKKIQICYEKKLPVIIYDEAGDFSKRAAMSRHNKSLINTFETFRAYGIIIIMCLPYYNTLDNSIFKYNVVRLLLHCSDRTKGGGYIRGYGIDGMGWLRIHMDEFKHREYMAYERQKPVFQARFSDLSPERSKALDTYCTKGKLKLLKKAGVNLNNLTDVKTLALKLERTESWVSKKLKELGAKPETRISHTYYYNPNYADKLKLMLKR